MKWLDIPPVWLAGCIAIAWACGRHFPINLGEVMAVAGAVLIGGGMGLVGLAAWRMHRHRTTIIPHQIPARLVSDGIFAWTRNPIYLADLLILTGVILRWEAALALPFVPFLGWILTIRFILPEERRLRMAFGATFDHYERNVRRWI